MVSRSEVERIGLFDSQLPLYEDWELRIRLTQSCRLAYGPEHTVEYRKNPKRISSSSHPGRHLDTCMRIYRKHQSFIESLSPDSRQHVSERLRPWIGRFAWRALREALQRNDQASAWTYFLDGMTYAPEKINLRVLAKLATTPEYRRQASVNTFVG